MSDANVRCFLKFCWLSAASKSANKLHPFKNSSAYVTKQFLSSSKSSELTKFNFASHSSIVQNLTAKKSFLENGAKKRNSCQFAQRRFLSSDAARKYLTNAYYVNGEWREAKSTFPVYNPYTSKVLADAANCTKDDTLDAIIHAAAAFEQWKKTTGKVNLKFFLCISHFDLIFMNKWP